MIPFVVSRFRVLVMDIFFRNYIQKEGFEGDTRIGGYSLDWILAFSLVLYLFSGPVEHLNGCLF